MSRRRLELRDLSGRPFDALWEREGDEIRIEHEGASTRFRVVEAGAAELILEALEGRDRGVRTRLFALRDGDRVHVVHEGRSWVLERRRDDPLAGLDEGDASHAELLAPMTGRVVKVAVAKGDPVEEGAAVIVVEAMKMEHQLRAPFRARIEELDCAEGDQVDLGHRLARLVRHEDDE